MKKNTKVIRQYYDNDCGPTSLLMLFKYFGKDVSLYSIKQSSDTRNDGTSMRSLVHVAKNFNFEAYAYQTDSLDKLKTISHPFIAHITREEEQHFTVIDQIRKKDVIIADPLDGYYKLSHNEFLKVFSGYFLFISPLDTQYSTSTTKEKESLERIKLHSGLIKKNKWKIAIIIFATLIMNTINFLNIYYFQRLVDDIVPLNDLRTLNLFSLLLIGLFCISSIFAYFRTKLIILLSQSLEYSLTTAFFKHVLYLPIRFFESINPGEIIARINDTYKVRDAVATIAITFFLDIVMLFVGAGVLIYLNTSMFLMILLLLPVYAILFFHFNKKYEKYNFEEMDRNAKLDSFLVQGISNITDIKSNTNENNYFSKYLIKLKEMLAKRYNLENTENIERSTRMLIDSLMGLAILWFGAYQVIIGEMSIGQLLAFVALLVYFLGPLNNLIGMHPLINSALVAIRRIQDVYMIPNEYTKEESKYSLTFSQVNFKNVGLKYLNNTVIAPFNLVVNKQKAILITGKSGTGKTSIAKMLMKFLIPTDGFILIDDTNIQNIDTKQLRRNVAYIGESPFFFEGTIYENLTFGLNEKLSHRTILEVCEKMHIKELVESLPQGVNSKLLDNGENLSSGQKQRLYLVKILLTDPSIIILDEATNHLDHSTEESIMKTLIEIKNEQHLILFIINHNKDMWSYADEILELN